MCERKLIAKVSMTNNLCQRKIVHGNKALQPFHVNKHIHIAFKHEAHEHVALKHLTYSTILKYFKPFFTPIHDFII